MVKVGDIITVTSARWGDEKARVIGGERKDSKRWVLLMLRSNKVRKVDKDKVPEQVVEPKKKIIKKKPKPDDSSQVSQSSQVSVSQPTKKIIKKKPKPPDMLQTIDLSSMPSVNSGVSESISEVIESSTIKDEAEKNKEVINVVPELSDIDDGQSKEDKPYFYRGNVYTAKWTDGVEWVLYDSFDDPVAYIRDGKVNPFESPRFAPELYSPREVKEDRKRQEEQEEEEILRQLRVKEKEEEERRWKERKEAEEQSRRETENAKKEWDLLNTMDLKEKIQFLVGKDPEKAWDKIDDMGRFILDISKYRKLFNQLVDKHGETREGIIPEKLPEFGYNEIKGLLDFDVVKKRYSWDFSLGTRREIFQYKLVPGESYNTLKSKYEEYRQKWMDLRQEYSLKNLGIMTRKHLNKFTYEGKQYRVIWDDEENAWMVLDDDGLAIGTTDVKGETFTRFS